jgi:hypothetical protein
MTNRFASYRDLANQWQIPDFSQFAFSDEGVEKKPTIRKLPRELSQQRIPPPRGTSSQISPSLQDPPHTPKVLLDRFRNLALQQATEDLERPIDKLMLMHCSLYQDPPQLLMSEE